MICEGDSWFAYPREWFLAGKPNNVVDVLREQERFNLLQLSSSGDEAVAMLSGASKLRLLRLLDEQRVDFLLFSGGGNDLVGVYDMPFFLQDGAQAQTADDCLHTERLERRLNSIEACYRDLIELCTEYSANPDLVVITHTYDYARPNPQGAVFAGGLLKIDDATSWMWPYMEAKHIPLPLREGVMRRIIDGLADRLLAVEADYPDRLSVVNTRNLLDPDRHWLNEIHPNPEGFALVAERIYARIRKLRGD